MLTEKEKVALDKNITAVPEPLEIVSETRKNAFGESVEFYQDDTGAPIYDTDTVYHLLIETETGTKGFLVLFERAQELLDEFEVELVTAKLSKHSDGKTFKKEMKETMKEMEEIFGE